MDILYFVVALLLWVVIAYCFYRVVRSLVLSVKKFIEKRKESVSDENFEH